MPRNEECHFCGKTDRVAGRLSRVNEPVRSMCTPCYQNFMRNKDIKAAGAVDVDETEIERPLSDDEMVAELLEMRENLS
jgi:hypothetical protein